MTMNELLDRLAEIQKVQIKKYYYRFSLSD